MKAQEAHPAQSSSNPRLLADLMDLEAGPARTWTADELAAVFRHQMSAPMQFDLARLGPARASQLRALCDGEGLLLRSFSDLFGHPNPPLELLRLTQEFAKLNRQAATSVIPAAVATVLYYASIAAAMVRCHARTTRMSDMDLGEGLRHILALPWLMEPIRGLCEQALSAVCGPDADVPGSAGVDRGSPEANSAACRCA